MSERPERGARYHHGDLRRALVDAALALLAEKGLAGVSLRAAAAAAGVSHAAPKNHFPTLSALLTALAVEGFRAHASALTHAAEAAESATERAVAAGEAYVAFAVAHPHLFRLMFARDRLDCADPALLEASAASFAVLRRIGGDGAPAAVAARIARRWSQVHGYADLAINGQIDVIERVCGVRPSVRAMLLA